MSQKNLEFKRVSKQYVNGFQALKSISFELCTGDFLALLGPNGAGKTTLINCLAGINTITEGDIKVNGVSVQKDPLYTKMQLGIVEQEISYDPFFTPIEILRMRRGLFGLKSDEAYLKWVLENLSLWDKRDVPPRHLSGGMKRRLMIAKALAHDPSILILDEPTAGVDIALRKSLYIFLQKLRSEHKKTILLTTHYLEEAEMLAEKIAILNHGSLLVCDKKQKILKNQERNLIIDLMDGQQETITISGQSINLDSITKKYPKIKNLSIQEPKLEDFFLKITK